MTMVGAAAAAEADETCWWGTCVRVCVGLGGRHWESGLFASVV